MKLMNIVAILGALAWLPQIITWVYNWFKKPNLSIYHEDESEVGFIKNGCAFNLRLSFLARNKPALIDDVQLQLTDKDGAIYNLTWVWYSETFYELQGTGGSATMAKKQNAIAINAFQDVLIEKFVGFQSPCFIQQRKELSYKLQAFIERQKSVGELNVDDIKRSKEYDDIIRLYKNSFIWKSGEYKGRIRVHIADTNQIVEHAVVFTLSEVEEDTLKKNLELVKSALEFEFIDPNTPINSNWLWAMPAISSNV